MLLIIINMPRKKTSKRKINMKTSRKKIGSKDVKDQRIEHFSEEVKTLGERFGKRMEEKGESWDSWFHRTLGLVGPLISSIFGLVILIFIIWTLNFVNLQIGSGILFSIQTFLLTNIGLFFLIFLFFSYTSYFSKAYPKIYMPFSPIVIAVGIIIGFWIIVNTINISNLYVGSLILSNITLQIEKNIFWIFGFVLVLGYLIFSFKTVTEKPAERIVMRKTPSPTYGKMHRIYRSGKDKILGGVCGGIAEYLGVDPVIIRLLWVFGAFIWGSGILLYIIAWIIIPRNPNHKWN